MSQSETNYFKLPNILYIKNKLTYIFLKPHLDD
jgi:hypothetical protein